MKKLLPLIATAAALPAQIALVTPNSGQLTVAETIQITWFITGAQQTTDWDIYYSTAGTGGPWTVIAQDVPVNNPAANTIHYYPWTVPYAALSSDLRVRVVQDNVGANYEAVSSSAITVVTPTAQNFPFGQSCNPATLIPMQNWMPILGGVMMSRVTGISPTAPLVAVVLAHNVLQFPVDLAFFGMPGCTLYIPTETIEFLPYSGGGSADLYIFIPNDPAFIGLDLYQQAGVFDSTVNSAGLEMTNALHAIISNQ